MSGPIVMHPVSPSWASPCPGADGKAPCGATADVMCPRRGCQRCRTCVPCGHCPMCARTDPGLYGHPDCPPPPERQPRAVEAQARPPLDLDAIEKRARAAKGGGWTQRDDFCDHALEDVLALLNEVRRLRDEPAKRGGA